MFKEWPYFKREYDKCKDPMMLDGYSWNENGLMIHLRSLSNKKYVVHFYLNVEIVKIECNTGSDLDTQNMDVQYVEKAGALPPCAGFYVTDDSDLVCRAKRIDEFSGNMYERKEYVHYIMTTEDFRIDVVSTEVPDIKQIY
ncbi:Uncharacterised protein [uncultured Butyricicoccus sp.]|jgi:hypothetical protein|nr:Uncharacterised protein [uncultured Butyricicoccus sp.]